MGQRPKRPAAGSTDFRPGDLSPMIYAGRVTTREARIWVCATPGPWWLDVRQGTLAQTLPLELSTEAAEGHTTAIDLEALGYELMPATDYQVVLRGPDGDSARCTFRTAPEDGGPDELVIGLLSCHNPFEEDGAYHERSLRFLQQLPEALARQGVERLCLMGDQVYADLPFSLSLFDDEHFASVAPIGRREALHCARPEVRALMQQRYRIFWRHPAWRALMGRFAVSLIPDDHEIVDNFGSDPDHASAAWQRWAGGALDAFHDFQGKAWHRERPDDFGHRFDLGRITVLVPDLRSHRKREGGHQQILGPQLERLRTWLHEARDQAVVVLVLSVPLVHVPDVLQAAAEQLEGQGGDIADRWSVPEARAERDQLVALLERHQRAHPHQRLVLAGGDMHVGAFFRMDWDSDELPDALQLVSSAVSNDQGPFAQLIAKKPIRMRHTLGARQQLGLELLEGESAYGGLNAGILRVKRTGDRDVVRMQLLGMAPDETDVEMVLDSGWL